MEVMRNGGEIGNTTFNAYEDIHSIHDYPSIILYRGLLLQRRSTICYIYESMEHVNLTGNSANCDNNTYTGTS